MKKISSKCQQAKEEKKLRYREIAREKIERQAQSGDNSE